MTSPILSSYLSRFSFNARGPLLAPVPTDRGSAPFTRAVAPLADAAFADVRAQAPDETAPEYEDEVVQAYGFQDRYRALELKRHEGRLHLAVLSAGSPQRVEIEQSSEAASSGDFSNYYLAFAMPYYRMLAGAGDVAGSDARSDQEIAFALAVRLYTESLPESWREKLAEEERKHPEMTAAERFGVSASDLSEKTVVFPGRVLLANDKLLKATDREREMLDRYAFSFGVGYDAQDGLGVDCRIDHALQDVAPTFARLFELSALLLSAELP